MDDSQDLRSGDPTGDPTQGGTAFAPWVLPMVQKSDFTKAFVDRILAHLSQLDESARKAPALTKSRVWNIVCKRQRWPIRPVRMKNTLSVV